MAVLPFADMSQEKDQAYFCEGVAEEIINALTRIPGLRVIARTSSFLVGRLGLDVREAGARLGVESVLEGSVPLLKPIAAKAAEVDLSGKAKKTAKPTTTAGIPSMRKSHCHPAMPNRPSICRSFPETGEFTKPASVAADHDHAVGAAIDDGVKAGLAGAELALGARALAAVRRFQPQIVFLDTALTGVDVAQLCRQIADDDELRAPAVVLDRHRARGDRAA